jgi:lipopolysaccharide transport system permease protein
VGRKPLFQRIRATSDLLGMLLKRDLDARYKGALLGKLWPLINQAVQIVIYTVVFSTIMVAHVDMPGLNNSRLAFGVWLFTGLLPWIGFAGGISASATSVVSQPNFVKKIVFPLPLLPVVPVITAIIESLFGMVPLLIVVVAITHKLHPTILLLPIVWVVQALFTIGLAYIAAAITVYLRDVPQSIATILNVWFYLTPIIYPLSTLPAPVRKFVQFANPLTAFIDVYRDLILAGRIRDPAVLISAGIWTLVVFTIGFTLYRRLQVAFADVL